MDIRSEDDVEMDTVEHNFQSIDGGEAPVERVDKALLALKSNANWQKEVVVLGLVETDHQGGRRDMLALKSDHIEVVGHIQIVVVVRMGEFGSEVGSGQMKKVYRLAEVVSALKSAVPLVCWAASGSAKVVSEVQHWVLRRVIRKGGKNRQREKMGSGRSELWLRNAVA
jgi:hypothetical protein